jgi:hypothetical protein
VRSDAKESIEIVIRKAHLRILVNLLTYNCCKQYQKDQWKSLVDETEEKIAESDKNR